MLGVLEAALDGKAPPKKDCVFLLKLPEASFEAELLRATANAISRKRLRDAGMLRGQIGVEIAPCPGKCKFCSFGEGHTKF